VARTGRCLCGKVSYSIEGDLIATAVCHCDHCQRQGGGAFSVNLIAHESQLSVDGDLATYLETNEAGDEVYVRRRFCGACGSPIVSEISVPQGLVAVKAGTLDDKSDVQPNVEAWCVDKQPWVTLPAMAVSMERE
jgi:hypothetical protein